MDVPDEIYILAELIIDGVIDRLKDLADDEEVCDSCPLKSVNANQET